MNLYLRWRGIIVEICSLCTYSIVTMVSVATLDFSLSKKVFRIDCLAGGLCVLDFHVHFVFMVVM